MERETRAHDMGGKRIDLEESGEKSEDSHSACSRGTGEAEGEMAGGKNIIISLVVHYQLDPHGHSLGNSTKAENCFQISLKLTVWFSLIP